MELGLRECIECHRYFIIENETDAICDDCAGKYKPHHLNNVDLFGRDWESLKIRKQWQKSAKKNHQKLLTKLKGTNYYN